VYAGLDGSDSWKSRYGIRPSIKLIVALGGSLRLFPILVVVVVVLFSISSFVLIKDGLGLWLTESKAGQVFEPILSAFTEDVYCSGGDRCSSGLIRLDRADLYPLNKSL